MGDFGSGIGDVVNKMSKHDLKSFFNQLDDATFCKLLNMIELDEHYSSEQIFKIFDPIEYGFGVCDSCTRIDLENYEPEVDPNG